MKIIASFILGTFLFSTIAQGEPQQAQGTLVVETKSSSGPISQVEVVIAGEILAVTDQGGEATLQLPVGQAEVTLQRFGFTPQTVLASIQEQTITRLSVELQAEVVRSEEITVTA